MNFEEISLHKSILPKIGILSNMHVCVCVFSVRFVLRKPMQQSILENRANIFSTRDMLTRYLKYSNY